ncbi:MAG: imidazole glycerol phosphate synthase subunit HisH, partial [Campylobacterales bacterium]|nr:imidazole glycerol phosphate synthase subunit HisH [Campylobacterales bacterium]
MIALINYGLGNIQAFVNVYQRQHIPVMVANTAEDIKSATKLILPGVGHFDHAMQLFNQSGMRETVEHRVLSEKTPILGICVGMQMLARRSDEGVEAGLGWIDGEVKALKTILPDDSALPLPHMGWNDIAPNLVSPIFKGFDAQDSRFYFLHSYFFECADASQNCIAQA